VHTHASISRWERIEVIWNTVNVWYRIESEGMFQVEYTLANSLLRQVKHDAKARLTLASTGAGGGEETLHPQRNVLLRARRQPTCW
jgi:hypothetical protein